MHDKQRLKAVQQAMGAIEKAHGKGAIMKLGEREAEDVAVIPYNPLAGGLLTGKHRPGAPTEGTRFTLGRSKEMYQERYWNDAMFESVESIRAVAEQSGTPMTTLAIQWVLANPVITSPIIGASRPDQLAASLAAVDRSIDASVKERLDEVTAVYRQGDHDR